MCEYLIKLSKFLKLIQIYHFIKCAIKLTPYILYNISIR